MHKRIAALLFIVGLVLVGRSSHALQLKESKVTLPADQQFTNTGRQVLASSPDGKYFVYVANTRLYLKSASNAQATPIAGTDVPQGLTNPVFSPDSKSIVFWSGADGTFKRIPVEGGIAMTLAKGGNPIGMSWGPGDQILFGQSAKNANGIIRISANGGMPETIVAVRDNEVAHGPQMLPDGESVLFTLATIPPKITSIADVWDKAKIVVQSLRTGERKTLLEDASDARFVPSGHIVYAAGERLFAVRFDSKRLEVTGKPAVILESVRRAGSTPTAQFSFSDSGSMVYLPAALPDFRLTFVDMKGVEAPAGTVPSSTFAPRLSPDGKQVTFDAFDPQSMAYRIYISDLATKRLRKLDGAGQIQRFPLWSPDGKRIIYISNPVAESSLYWQAADGTGTPERLLETARAPEFWSAANRFLSFITLKTNANTADYDIWSYSFETKTASPIIVIPGSAQHSSRFSPDGHWIAYISDETGRHEVFVQPFPVTGTKYQITKNGGGHPLWSPDGKQLFFDNNQRMFSVQVQTQPSFTAGDPQPLPISGFIQGTGNNRRQYDMTSDGKQFLMMFPVPDEIHVNGNWFDELNRRSRN
jgi:eukaryotic-like serine/threonine-protein kinase